MRAVHKYIAHGVQFVVTHAIPQTEIPALQYSWVKYTFRQNVVFTNNCLSLHFCKNITCLRVCLLEICQVFPVFCKTVYQWVMTNCCCMSDTSSNNVQT